MTPKEALTLEEAKREVKEFLDYAPKALEELHKKLLELNADDAERLWKMLSDRIPGQPSGEKEASDT